MNNYRRDLFVVTMLSRGISVRPISRPPLGKKAIWRGKRDTHTYDNQPDLRPAIISNYNREVVNVHLR